MPAKSVATRLCLPRLLFGTLGCPHLRSLLQWVSAPIGVDAFNSPFRPFVLATTSVGQDGLDFHPYYYRVYHWNLPGNPVDLEQREGRVHRFEGHAVHGDNQGERAATIRMASLCRSERMMSLLIVAGKAVRLNLAERQAGVIMGRGQAPDDPWKLMFDRARSEAVVDTDLIPIGSTKVP